MELEQVITITLIKNVLQKVFNVYDNVLTDVGDIQDVANAGASMETGNLISHIACFLS